LSAPSQQPDSSASPEWRTEPPPGGWEAAPSGGERVPNKKALIIAGALATAAGIGSILVPAVASVGTAVFVGCGLLVVALASALAAIFGAHGFGPRLLRGLVALIAFAVGLYLLVSPLEGTFTLTVMLVIWFVATGVVRIAVGIREIGKPEAGYTILAGAVSLVLGLLIAVELPSSADWAIGLLVGIDFLIYGLLCFAQAFLGRDAASA